MAERNYKVKLSYDKRSERYVVDSIVGHVPYISLKGVTNGVDVVRAGQSITESIAKTLGTYATLTVVPAKAS
mgnify:CR=1 FL=1|tara:strand:- start:1279 stop:1494 length:216 start_codon:yes stop_codon:yes gene_type:complete